MSTQREPLVLTIDAGSGSCRALTWDSHGNIVTLSQREWDYQISEHPGGLDFDCSVGWQLISECIREAIDGDRVQAQDIKAVTSTSMREGFVLYDSEGNEIWAIPNVDGRAQEQANTLLEQGYGEEFFSEAGDWTSLAASARLLWVKEKAPEVWARTAKMGMLADWVLTKLSGQYVSEPSIASSSTMMNITSRNWSEKIATTLGIEHILPTIYESGSIIGEVTPQAAQETGLLAGTPVVTGGADTQLGLIGSGVCDPYQVGIVGGTYWLTCGVVDQPLLDPQMRLRTLALATPGQWMIEGCGFAHGMSTRWVRDGLLRSANPTITIDEGYKVLGRLAQQVPPGSNGLNYTASAIMNTKSWKHPAVSLVGINPWDIASTSLGAIFRAVMEEASYGARGHVELIKQVWDHPVTEVNFVGGASNSELWCQLLADVLNATVKVPNKAEGTCLGAALAGFKAIGTYSSLKEGSLATVQIERTYEPNPINVAAYDELFPTWKELTNHMLTAADEGLSPYFWVGAGARSPKSR